MNSGTQLVIIVVIALVVAALVGVLVLVGMRASRLGQELDTAERKIEALQAEIRALMARIAAMLEEDKKKTGWLDNLDAEANHLRIELDKRPEIRRQTYKILTLGMKATGKTSLTLKWSNPLVDLGTIEGTKIERYERSVSHVQTKNAIVEHVFEVHDWGGEHIVDAQQELIVEEIHGLLVVVDLGGRDATQVEPARVQEQLQEFQPQALRYFFGPKTVASCKTVVLFINKSDLIAGTPAQVEEYAIRLYQPLIDNLMRYATQIDVKVFVGSANYGHSTHLLFSHFVEKILPRHAYDNQLLQRMKQEFGNQRALAAQPLPMPPMPPVSQQDPLASQPVSGFGGGVKRTNPMMPALPSAPQSQPGFGAPPQRPGVPVAPGFGQKPPAVGYVDAPAGLGDTAPLMTRPNMVTRKL